jgi:hypothetical protein
LPFGETQKAGWLGGWPVKRRRTTKIRLDNFFCAVLCLINHRIAKLMHDRDETHRQTIAEGNMRRPGLYWGADLKAAAECAAEKEAEAHRPGPRRD